MAGTKCVTYNSDSDESADDADMLPELPTVPPSQFIASIVHQDPAALKVVARVNGPTSKLGCSETARGVVTKGQDKISKLVISQRDLEKLSKKQNSRSHGATYEEESESEWEPSSSELEDSDNSDVIICEDDDDNKDDDDDVSENGIGSKDNNGSVENLVNSIDVDDEQQDSDNESEEEETDGENNSHVNKEKKKEDNVVVSRDSIVAGPPSKLAVSTSQTVDQIDTSDKSVQDKTGKKKKKSSKASVKNQAEGIYYLENTSDDDDSDTDEYEHDLTVFPSTSQNNQRKKSTGAVSNSDSDVQIIAVEAGSDEDSSEEGDSDGDGDSSESGSSLSGSDVEDLKQWWRAVFLARALNKSGVKTAVPRAGVPSTSTAPNPNNLTNQVRPGTNKVTLLPYDPHKKPREGPVSKQQPNSSVLHNDTFIPAGLWCSLNCVGMKGMAPSLQCDKCMRLFHYACAHMDVFYEGEFVCQVCTQDKKAELPVSKPDYGKVEAKAQGCHQNDPQFPVLLSYDRAIVDPSPLTCEPRLPALNSGLSAKDDPEASNDSDIFFCQIVFPDQVEGWSMAGGNDLNKHLETKNTESSSELPNSDQSVESLSSETKGLPSGKKRRRLFCSSFSKAVKKLCEDKQLMMRILECLSLGQLLKLREVCKQWKELVEQSTLLKNISLQNVYVKDWCRATEFFNKIGLETLNLQGCVSDIDSTGSSTGPWSAMMNCLSALTSLKSVTFGPTQSCVLQKVKEQLSHLDVLTTADITVEKPNKKTKQPRSNSRTETATTNVSQTKRGSVTTGKYRNEEINRKRKIGSSGADQLQKKLNVPSDSHPGKCGIVQENLQDSSSLWKNRDRQKDGMKEKEVVPSPSDDKLTESKSSTISPINRSVTDKKKERVSVQSGSKYRKNQVKTISSDPRKQTDDQKNSPSSRTERKETQDVNSTPISTDLYKGEPQCSGKPQRGAAFKALCSIVGAGGAHIDRIHSVNNSSVQPTPQNEPLRMEKNFSEEKSMIQTQSTDTDMSRVTLSETLVLKKVKLGKNKCLRKSSIDNDNITSDRDRSKRKSSETTWSSSCHQDCEELTHDHHSDLEPKSKRRTRSQDICVGSDEKGRENEDQQSPDVKDSKGKVCSKKCVRSEEQAKMLSFSKCQHPFSHSGQSDIGKPGKFKITSKKSVSLESEKEVSNNVRSAITVSGHSLKGDEERKKSSHASCDLYSGSVHSQKEKRQKLSNNVSGDINSESVQSQFQKPDHNNKCPKSDAFKEVSLPVTKRKKDQTQKAISLPEESKLFSDKYTKQSSVRGRKSKR